MKNLTSLKWVGLAIVAAQLLATACAPASTPAATKAAPTATAVPGKTELVISQGIDPSSLNPLDDLTGGGTNVNVQNHIFDTLVRRDEKMNIIPWVAESWKTIDANTWEFKIRPGIKFHNGEDLDATAVKYTWDMVKLDDPRMNATHKAWYAPVKRVDVVDKYTVRFITSEPYPHLITYMTNRPMIVPPKYFEATWQLKDQNAFKWKPIGSGPYKLVEFIPDQRLVLERNPDYWGNKATFQRVTFRPIIESSTRLAELMTGGLDLINQVTADQAEQLKAQGFVVKSAPSVQVIYAALPPARIPDKRVRQALFYAVNGESIVKDIFQGYAILMKSGSAVTPEEFGYDPSLKPYPYDPAKAKALLAEAGYKDTNGNGIVDKDGKDLVLWFTTYGGRNPHQEEVVEAIAENWRAVGVGTKLEIMEYGMWREAWQGRKATWDVWVTSTGTRTFDADARLINMIHTYRTVEKDGYAAGSVSFYSNPSVDEKIDKARTEVDEAMRKQLYKDLLTELREDAFFLSLYQQVDLYAHNKCVQGFTARADMLTLAQDMTWKCP